MNRQTCGTEEIFRDSQSLYSEDVDPDLLFFLGGGDLYLI